MNTRDALPLLQPQGESGWVLPPNVRAVMSTRQGGAGVAPFDSFNLALDAADPAVAENRRRFIAALGAQPRWLRQVHGNTVVTLAAEPWAQAPSADASVTTVPGVASVVFAADCLPVLFCAPQGRAVGAAHAGWRGLAAGVLEASVERLCELAACQPGDLTAWLGPCIGPQHFEVGDDVLRAFGHDAASAPPALFRPQASERSADGRPRWRADLVALARQRLQACGLHQLSGGSWCTYSEASRFFSFRRDGRSGPTGRMAAAIAIVG